MKIGPYVERLHNSKEFKDFRGKNPDIFMVAGFFILDLESGNNVHQVDYYIPKEKKVAAFTLDHGVKVQTLELMNSKVPEELDLSTKIDLDALKGILQDEMKNRSITEDIKKIIAVIQTINGKKIWNLNCVLSGMGILRAHIEDESKSVLKMEKASIMDYIRKMPGMAGAGAMPKMPSTMPGMPKMPGMNESDEEGDEVSSSPMEVQSAPKVKQDAKEQIKKLEQLEAAIEAEKKRLEAPFFKKEKEEAVKKEKEATLKKGKKK